MGVPKFYRWLSERYPCLSEVVKEHQIPEFDNLYLDMNGIIHICSHPNDDDPHFRITEEQIFASIFHYIEVLFRLIQPRKVFFMAVDGVAPRAKMNQQRGRRFRSAKEAEMNEKKAKDRGEKLPEEARFDSNCITPGTPFMVRLQSQLQYFVTNKISTDPLWQRVRVVLSGHETPGEGEHKIMDYIRYEKSRPGYDPNVRHCLYGLDADLMMLGMATHDPHFSLLREEVRFGGKKNAAANKRTPTAEDTTFHLLHLSLLREYLDHEFSDVREKLVTFDYDLESIIDDWILLGFLVGNDFLPHLPHLHINKGALTELYQTYKSALPSLGGYINVGGELQLARFEKFLKVLSLKEMERFDDIYSDAKWLEGKTAARTAAGRHTVKPTPGPANVFEMLEGVPEPGVTNQAAPRQDRDLMRLINSADEYLSGSDESTPQRTTTTATADENDYASDESDSGRDRNYHMEFRQHKRDYYISKLGYDKVDAAVLTEQAECYVRGIQWNLHYYYNGCMSWSWFYPHHYAPWLTDIKNFSGLKLEFEMGKPFLPFEQLLAVLPPASRELLPKPVQDLMMNETSPIIDYFPKDFECDLNGKQQEWEAVVLINFINEDRLLSAMKPVLGALRPQEAARNTHGPMNMYDYTPDCLGTYESPGYFPAVPMNFAKLTDVWRREWDVAIKDLKKGLMDGVRLDVFFPGFPTLKHISHTAKLSTAGVRVFEQPSRGQNTLLTLKGQGKPNVKDVAQELLGAEIWVSWPHMVEAKVMGVKDAVTSYSIDSRTGQMRQESNEDDRAKKFAPLVTEITSRYKTRWGVEIGPTHVLLLASPMTGRKYVCGPKGKITLEKQWSRISHPYALQTTRKDILVHDPSFAQYRTLDQLYPEGASCFMLGQPNYGCQGEVLQVSKEHKGRVQIKFVEPQEVNLGPVFRIKDELSVRYYPGFRAAQMLGVSSHLLSRITGTIFICKSPKGAESDRASRINVGLNLKLNKKNEEVAGFTQKRTTDSNWYYSDRALADIGEYMRMFPDLFQYLGTSDNVSHDMYQVEDVFLDYARGVERLTELTNWMKELPSSKAPRQTCGMQSLDEELVKALEKAVEGHNPVDKRKCITMQVRPHLLYKPNLYHGSSMPDDTTKVYLFDRVVNVREGYSVPLGLRGTVTGIHPSAIADNQLLEVNFDQEFRGGLALRSTKLCSYRVPASAVINISHGNRSAKKGNGSTTSGSNGRGQSVSSSGASAARYPSPKKPMAVVPPLDPNFITQPQQPSGQPMPGMTPPDPKNLPNPMLLFGKQDGKKSNKQNGSKKAAKNPTVPCAAGEPDVMQNLWKSLENSTKTQSQQPQVQVLQRQQPPHVPMPTEEAMSRDLTNMLNINPQGAAGGKSSVEAFFAAAAASTSGGNAMPKPPPMPAQRQQKIDADSSFCKRLMGMLESHEHGRPTYTFSEGQKGLPVATVVLPWGEEYEGSEERDWDSAAESAAQQAVDAFEAKGGLELEPAAPKQSTAFVPMQVARKIVRTKSVSEKKKKQKADIKLDAGEADGPDRVAAWVMASQGQGALPPQPDSGVGNVAAPAPAPAPEPQGRQQQQQQPESGRGRGRGGRGRGVVRQPQGPAEGQGFGRGQRKPRLAANFGGPPS